MYRTTPSPATNRFQARRPPSRLPQPRLPPPPLVRANELESVRVQLMDIYSRLIELAYDLSKAAQQLEENGN